MGQNKSFQDHYEIKMELIMTVMKLWLSLLRQVVNEARFN